MGRVTVQGCFFDRSCAQNLPSASIDIRVLIVRSVFYGFPLPWPGGFEADVDEGEEASAGDGRGRGELAQRAGGMSDDQRAGLKKVLPRLLWPPEPLGASTKPLMQS